MLNRLLSSSRYLVLIAVISTLLASTCLLIFGAVATVQTIIRAFAVGDFSSKASKLLLVSCVELVDTFLLATVLYIIAVGLYELFIDEKVAMPAWLEIRTLDDLKEKLIGVVVVVLAVNFLGQFVGWDGGVEILAGGAAVAVVIGALTLFLREKGKKAAKESPDLAAKDDETAAT